MQIWTSSVWHIGDGDPRLRVHEDTIGTITASGEAVEVQRDKAFVALKKDNVIAFENVRLKLDAGGIRAVDKDGTDLGSHQAFWFAWSEIHPNAAPWPG